MNEKVFGEAAVAIPLLSKKVLQRTDSRFYVHFVSTIYHKNPLLASTRAADTAA